MAACQSLTVTSVTVSLLFFLVFFLYEGNIFCIVPPADATFRGVAYNPSELPKMIRGITGKKFASIF